MRRKTVKEYNREKLIAYLGDPDNAYLTRAQLSTQVLGYKHENGIYNSFSPEELTEVEADALIERRKKYAPHLATADLALCRQAAEGDVKAIKLMYERFEGWRGNDPGAAGGGGGQTTVIVIRTAIPDAQPAVDLIQLDQVWGEGEDTGS